MEDVNWINLAEERVFWKIYRHSNELQAPDTQHMS